MAEAVPAPAKPEPIDGPVVYEPSDGMAISTVKVTRVQDAFVAVEHPEDWSDDEVLAALEKRQMDFAEKVSWWDSKGTTTIDGVALGENDPDDPHREPFALGDAPAEPDPADEPNAETPEGD